MAGVEARDLDPDQLAHHGVEASSQRCRTSASTSWIPSGSILAIVVLLSEQRQLGMHAVTVISTMRSGEFSAATVTVVRAGLFVGKYFAYSSL